MVYAKNFFFAKHTFLEFLLVGGAEVDIGFVLAKTLTSQRPSTFSLSTP